MTKQDFYVLSEMTGGARRSAVLLIPYSYLQACFAEPRQLWGGLRNFGAVVCLDSTARQRPVESHLHGSIRAAQGFGLCVIPSDLPLFAPSIAPRYLRASFGDIVVNPAAINVRILEGRGAWLSGPAIEPPPSVNDLNLPMHRAEFAALAWKLPGGQNVVNTRTFAATYAVAGRYEEFSDYSVELIRLANELSRFKQYSSGEDHSVVEFVESYLQPSGVSPQDFASNLYVVIGAIITNPDSGAGDPEATITDYALATDGLDNVLGSLNRVISAGDSVPNITSDCFSFLRRLRDNLQQERSPVFA